MPLLQTPEKLIGHTFTLHLLNEKREDGEPVRVLDVIPVPGLLKLDFLQRRSMKVAWVPLLQITSLYQDAEAYGEDD